MDSEFWHLLCLVSGLLVNSAIQMLVARRIWLKSFVMGFLAGYAVLAGLTAAVGSLDGKSLAEFTAIFVGISIAYAACGFSYFNIVNGGKSSLRVRILAEIQGASDGLDVDELLKRYPPAGMFRIRLTRMLAHGQVVVRGGRLCTGQRTLIAIGLAMIFMKRLVLKKRSEFD
jgi:hypothetical protein